jgi:CubicO group peptidase (beta-lactamase class C family)
MQSRSSTGGVRVLILVALIGCLVAPAATAMQDALAGRDGGFAAAAPENVGLSAAALSELGATVQRFVDQDLLVGGELLVIKDRRVALHQGFGLVDRDSNQAWAPNTICNLRSMSKTFTGAAAQILIDRGQLALDDLVSEYLPGFDNDKSREITIDQLMTHRSGLPLSILLTRESMRAFPSLVEMAEAVGERGPEFAPGSKFWYSDAGSDVLAAVVEKITGKSIDEFWRTELFEPLGMRNTFVALDASDPRFAGIAPLYFRQFGAWLRLWTPADGPFYPYAWGSQSAYGTSTDYAKFLAMWMDQGKAGDRPVLSPGAVARTLSPISPMSMLGSDLRVPTDFAGLEVWYGCMSVLHVPTQDPATSKPQIIGHSGSDGTIAWAWPERDLMILLFTQSRGGNSTLRIEEAIERLLLHPEGAAAAAATPEKFSPMIGTYIANFATYRNEEFRVLVKNGKLALDIPSQMAFELIEPETIGAGSMWKFAIAPERVSVSFDKQENGHYAILTVHQGGMSFEVPRKGREVAEDETQAAKVDPGRVKPLLGEYIHPEAQANGTVVLEGDVLCLRSSEGHVYHLEPSEDGASWMLKEVPGATLTFEFDDQGEVVSMTRHMGGRALVMFRHRGTP